MDHEYEVGGRCRCLKVLVSLKRLCNGYSEEAYILLHVALVERRSGLAAGRWGSCQGCILLVWRTRNPPESSHLCDDRWLSLILTGVLHEDLGVLHGLCDSLAACNCPDVEHLSSHI